MSHWAKVDKNNKVIRVLVGDNNDPAGDEGYQWLIDNLGGTWIKTSYNNKIRFNYAGIGYTFDATKGTDGAFIAPRPTCGHSELTLDETTCRWVCTNSAHEVEMP
jgi:hypothetical protein